jgi:hypothetical protein
MATTLARHMIARTKINLIFSGHNINTIQASDRRSSEPGTIGTNGYKILA